MKYDELTEEEKDELLRAFMKSMPDRQDRICDNCGELRMCAVSEQHFLCLDCFVNERHEEEE